MRECLWLVKHGVPFDVAFAIDDVTRAGWAIILSEQNNPSSKFSFNTMQFEDDK